MSALWRSPRLVDLRPPAFDQVFVTVSDSLTRAAAAVGEITGEVGEITGEVGELISTGFTYLEPHVGGVVQWVTGTYTDWEAAIGQQMLIAVGIMCTGFVTVIAAPFIVSRRL